MKRGSSVHEYRCTVRVSSAVTQRGSESGSRSWIRMLSRFFHGARKAIRVPSGEIDAPDRAGDLKKSSTAIMSGSAMVFLCYRSVPRWRPETRKSRAATAHSSPDICDSEHLYEAARSATADPSSPIAGAPPCPGPAQPGRDHGVRPTLGCGRHDPA